MRERRVGAPSLSRDLAGRGSVSDLLERLPSPASAMAQVRVAVLRPGERGRLAVAAGERRIVEEGVHEIGVAQWAFDHGQPAGLETDTLPGSKALHLPLMGPGGVLGVLSIQPVRNACMIPSTSSS